jgi:small subunit ribosomal protein S17
MTECEKSGGQRRKVQEGRVVSDKMDKTVVVAVTRQVAHKTYGKYVRRTSKYLAQDEEKSCGVGDTVRISETRPLSRRKRWRVVEVVQKAL